MSRNTVKQGGLRNTIKQGIQMLQGRDVPNYTLVFLDPTSDKRSGEEQTIWNPYITLGRASGSTIKYSDQYPTVSRNHAYIMIEGNRVFIEPDINATNPTIINHNPIRRKSELSPGDEIQLSHEGPRLRYINTPANRTTASMKFTQRLQQFGSQALRPYKTALSIMSVLLIGLATYLIWFSGKANEKMEYQAAQLEIQNQNIKQLSDSLSLIENKYNSIKDKTSSEAIRIRNEMYSLTQRIKITNEVSGPIATGSSNTSSSVGTAAELKQFEKSVYFIIIKSVEVYHPDENDALGPFDLAEKFKYKWSGTGFMTTEGELITARHVIEPWRFGVKCESNTYDTLNAIQVFLNNAEIKGGNVEVTYEATSSSGDKFTFTNKSVVMDESRDRIICNDEKKYQWRVKQCSDENLHTDWAKIIVGNRRGLFKLNRDKSLKLEKGTSLFGLGYSHGSDMQSRNTIDLDPMFLTGTVVQQNTVNGMINISSSEIAAGSSGGPIMVKTSIGWEAIGIISNGYVGGLKQLVPIWQVR